MIRWGRYCWLLFGVGRGAARYLVGCFIRRAVALAVPRRQLDGKLRLPCRGRRVRTGGANGRPAGKLIVRWSMAGGCGVWVCVRGGPESGWGLAGDGAEGPAGAPEVARVGALSAWRWRPPSGARRGSLSIRGLMEPVIRGAMEPVQSGVLLVSDGLSFSGFWRCWQVPARWPLRWGRAYPEVARQWI